MSFLDGAGMGLGFTFALLCLGLARELLASGSLFGWTVFGDSFEKWVIMALPGGGFFMLGIWIMIFNRVLSKQKHKGTSP